MDLIVAFFTTEKTYNNSHKFGFTLSPTNYGHPKMMIQPFLLTNNLFGYIYGHSQILISQYGSLMIPIFACYCSLLFQTPSLNMFSAVPLVTCHYLWNKLMSLTRLLGVHPKGGGKYVDALAYIGEPVKEKDLVMRVISGLCNEYNGLK
uniref:Uncharacterized protein n=1 Tax=Lactuca sativa TaxID=4236 RepID=A0A9R1W6H0_LACSA|nr:hypothetical protein LSAT_V11C300146710 [Lactuca sativa]